MNAENEEKKKNEAKFLETIDGEDVKASDTTDADIIECLLNGEVP